MDGIRLNFFLKFLVSIAGLKSYKYFLKMPTGKAVSYLFLLTISIGILSLIRPVYEFNKGIQVLNGSIIHDAPQFSISDGKLHVEGEMPILLTSGKDTVIIDTTGKTGVETLSQYPSVMLITAEQITEFRAGKVSRSNDFGQLRGLSLTKADVIKILPMFKYFSIIIIIMGIVTFFIGKLISAFIVGLIGLIINHKLKTYFSLNELFKLSAYALTLPIVIKVILGLINLNIPFFWVFYYGLAAVYLSLAIKSIKKDEDNPIGW